MHSKNLYKSATDCWSLAMFDRFRTVLLHVARNKMNSIHLPPEASDYAALDCLHLLINSNEKIRSTNFNVHSFYDFTNSSNKKIPWRKRHLDRKKPTTPRSSPSLLILLRLKTWMVWNLEKQIPCLTSGEDLFPPGGWRMDGGWYLVDLCVFWWFLMAILFTSILMKFFASAKTKGGGSREGWRFWGNKLWRKHVKNQLFSWDCYVHVRVSLLGPPLEACASPCQWRTMWRGGDEVVVNVGLLRDGHQPKD